MYLICKFCDSLLLCHIEFTLIHTISLYLISQLSTGKLMQNQTLLARVNYRTIVKGFKFLYKLCFFRKLCKYFKYLIVHCLCSVIISKTFYHRDAVILYTVCTVFTRHHFYQIDTICLLKFLIRSKGVQIFPVKHN